VRRDTPEEAPAAVPVIVEPVETVEPVDTIVTEEVALPVEKTPMSTADWEELERQREIAFKIVYFFIGFIIFTFGLLYAYYKVDQKEQEEEKRKKRALGAFYGEATNGSFFDFLAGQMDDE